MERPELLPAINLLEEELTGIERQARELRNTINMLCKRGGMAPRYSEAAEILGGSPTLSQIRPDTFYGKKMQTAAREFLDMRKNASLGPAKPREIFDALSQGGFEFEAQDETTALISLRATLRKNSATFHKLPNGQYGLKAWYPNVKVRPEEDDDEAPAKPSGSKRPAKANAKAAPPKPQAKVKAKTKEKSDGASARSAPADLTPFILNAMSDGAEWDTEGIKRAAIANSVPGIDEGTSRAVVHGALLGLKNRAFVVLVEKGKWKLTDKGFEAAIEGLPETSTTGTQKASAA